jgi:cell wall assembly regulator SMI1
LSTVSDGGVQLVRQAWGEVLAWCRQHAPVTAAAIQGPADERALTSAQAETGLRWPEQLLVWLRMSDGGALSSDAAVIPVGFVPLGVGHIVEKWRMLTDIAVEVGPADDLAEAERQPAGTKSFGYLKSWLPVAWNFGSSFLFLDLRPGPGSASVAKYDDDLGYLGHPIWQDIADMIASVAAALHAELWVNPADPDDDWVPDVDSGRLQWSDPRHSGVVG